MSSPGWGSRARAGIAWSTAAFAGGKAFTFVSTLVLARLLAPSEFGVVAAILVFLVFIELVSDLGMKATLVYEQERDLSARVQTALTINLVFAAVLTGIAVLLAPAVAAFFDLEGRTDLFRLGALNILLTGLGNVHDAVLLRSMEFRRRIVPELFRAGVRGVVAIVLAVAGLGASSLLIGLLAGTFVWVLVQWAMTPLRPTFAFDRTIARSMVGYGTDAAALETLAVLVNRADTVVVGSALGARSLGLYSIAQRVPELAVDAVTWNVAHVSFPALSRERVTAGGSVKAATLSLLRWQALYAVPVTAGIAILASPLVVVLFSSTWTEAGPVLSALAVLSALLALAFPVGTALRAVGRQRALVLILAIQLPLLVGAMIAVSSEGIVAVAWARTAVAVAYLAMMVVAGARAIGIPARELAAATGPALACGLGVVAGAGAVRLGWSDLSVGPVLAGTVAGAAGGIAALRLLAPSQFHAVRDALAGVRRARRVPVSPAAADVEERETIA